MVDYKKVILGVLILLIASTVVYIQFRNDLKMRVDTDKSTFYTKAIDENGEPYGRWRVSGREYSSLFDGTSKMNRRLAGITVDSFINEEEGTARIVRTTPYIRGPVIVDEWFFKGDIEDEKLFPIYHTVRVINGSGKYFRYEVRDLIYDGPTDYDLEGETLLHQTLLST